MTLPRSVGWTDRPVPLRPSACIAFGDAARALARRLLALDPEHLARLTGVASSEVVTQGAGSANRPTRALLVRGAADDLPWIDGVRYLGVDAAADWLLLPTTRRPDVPLQLFAAALRVKFDRQPTPLAVCDAPSCAIAAGRAEPIDAATLRAWLGAPC